MRIGVFGILLCWAGWTMAQSGEPPVRYISDEIAVTLRKGEGISAQVAALVKTGTRVELLEEGSESGYSRVRIAPGREGWVLAKYLSVEPPARERVAAMAAKLAEQQALVRKLSAQNERLSQSAVIEPDRQPDDADDANTEPEAKPVVDTLTDVGLVVAGVLLGLLIPLVRGGNRRKKWTPDL